ncbi:MAG: Na/Pi cotransporter family protein [Oscillospiraceae bacterium]|jgi:phosphate:Na+ symporter
MEVLRSILNVIKDHGFDAIKLFGGLAMFLYGMSMLGTSLEKASSGRMEKILEKLTSNILKSVILGALVTAAVQSSSATTVIVVGLVNAGILKLGNAVGVIMGANIGTTVTGQLLRLGDLESNENANFILQLLKPKVLSSVILIIGILMFMAAKKSKYKNIGGILLGFGVLFNGMFVMEASVSGLQDNPAFKEAFATLSNPILGVLVGAGVTALIQSSSASVGILQALSSSKAITCSAAFPIIMGQNIGTCITALMSSLGANKNAKRAAMVHLYFNIIGSALFLAGVYTYQAVIGFDFWDDPITRGGIADFHTLFNVVVTLCLIPFAKLLEKLACMTIKNKVLTEDHLYLNDDTNSLDERFLKSPSLALQQAHKTVIQMGKYAQYNFREMRQLYIKYDTKAVDRIREYEDAIDTMEDRLNNYLLLLNDKELNDSENRSLTALLHLLSEYERIGDYTINLVEISEQMFNNNTHFSEKAKNEFKIICDAVDEIIEMSITASTFGDLNIATNIEPLEEVIDQLVDTLKSKHIQRFKTGNCMVDAGVYFLDILTNLERISDHCSNIAVYLIIRESKKDNLNRHEYIQTLHKGGSQQYQVASIMYAEKYKLKS